MVTFDLQLQNVCREGLEMLVDSQLPQGLCDQPFAPVFLRDVTHDGPIIDFRDEMLDVVGVLGNFAPEERRLNWCKETMF